jgi:uncharacterized protein (DUF2062 family)
MPEASSAPSQRRKLWQRWFADPLVQQLTQGVSPEKIALTLAVGSAAALFPILGTTTLLCIAAGVALKLNQPIIQSINALCGLIWIPLFIAFVRLGEILTRAGATKLDISAMFPMFRHHPAEFFREFGATAWHGVLGWAVFAPIWIPLAYFVTRFPLRAAARKIKRRGQAV